MKLDLTSPSLLTTYNPEIKINLSLEALFWFWQDFSSMSWFGKMIETKQSNNFIVSFQVLLQKLSKSDEQVKIEKQQKRCRRLWLELELAEARAGEKLDWEKSGSWTFDRTASQKAALISAASSSKFVIGKFFTGEQVLSFSHNVSVVVLTRITRQYEFESCWLLIFSVLKDRNKRKRSRFGPS